MAILCFDYGHGGTDPGATYNGRKESMDVLNLGKKVAADVRRHGVTVDEIRTTDATVSLSARSAYENKKTYDYFVSFHRNAFKPEQAKGVETFTYLYPGTKATQLATKIQNNLVGVGFTNRGVKTADFHVLRETKAPAVLIEIGFIDNTGDNNIFDSKNGTIVEEVAKAILAQLGIPYQSGGGTTPGTLYRVMAGSYSVRANAEAQVERLKAAGFDATIMISGSLYRVMAGSYSIRANAEAQVERLKAAGFDAVIMVI